MLEDQRHVLPELLLGKSEILECGTLSSWFPVWRATSSSHSRYGPYVNAIAAAFRADRLAWAFFSGYQGALQAAFPELLAGAEPRIASLGANESGRKLTEIDTALFVTDGVLRLTGQKSWVLADIDDLELFVLARTADGPARGPGSLVVARVRRSAAGVEMSAPPTTGGRPGTGPLRGALQRCSDRWRTSDSGGRIRRSRQAVPPSRRCLRHGLHARFPACTWTRRRLADSLAAALHGDHRHIGRLRRAIPQ